ncbi:exocyst complex component 8 [Anoplophora glabripennis]|uniref:exocyst complex component 8 n=1 Tax=Anoplophora glabripennis TaxID=217634 RepID=UPI00087357EF|nr:exocyst complex component 8 [Anoplophora glabripennis]
MEVTKEPSFQLLSSKDFAPDKYVRDLSQSYVGGSELQNLRKKIQALSEETSNNLKRNVYQNYVQFIDTAKEISHLESEMYQLSHLLSEQKSLLGALSTTSILEDSAPINIERENKVGEKDIEEENKQKIAGILEKVEGCKELLEVPGRTFLYEGDLLEIDPTENTALKTVHVYLFTDGFMITTRNPNSRGLMKYVYEVMYDLSSLAVVNVRDLGNVKHAFKLLIFPDTRVFQCSSNSNKKEWLDKFDQAKKTRLAQEQQKRESIVEKSPSRSLSMESPSLNPFDDAEEDSGTIHPEWFMDIPEELDVCVAQRHFEDALTFLQKAKDYISQFVATNTQPDQVVIDIQRKVEQRQNNLTEVLMKELEVNPDKSLQGGLRAARRAVRLLNQLGRSTQSCDLFLKLCSSMLKTQCKRVKREGSTTMYVRHLSSVVFTNMCHMSDEFLRAFPDSPSCASAYVVWASGELSLFTTHFAKQVFMPQTSLSTITECVVMVRTQCERLCTYGVDLCYQLDGALRSPLTRGLREARDKLIDSIKLRSLDDKWIPMNLHSKSAVARCLQEHSNMGLELSSYITGDTWIQLTASTLSFTKMFLTLLEDCMRLKTTELIFTIDETLYNVFEAQIRHTENSLRNELNQDHRQFVVRNADFLLDTVINVSQKKYKDAVGYECPSLAKLRKEYSAITRGVSPAVRSTKTKYSSEFL